MDHDFWHERWEEGRIGFHEGRPNALLVRHLERLRLSAGDTVFVPLCGMAEDLTWLRQQGYRVTGIDLSPKAVEEVFSREGLAPEVTQVDGLTRYAHGEMVLFAGDVFALTTAALGPVDAVFDRAALVALPPDMRPRYVRHILALGGAAPHLLVTFDYDQSRMDGPPFSVPAEEVERLYAPATANLLGADPVTGPMADRTGVATESAWLITPDG